MIEKPYRIEKVEMNGHIRYYLIKDIQFKDRKAKIRKRIENPDVTNTGFDSAFDLELETKAISKKAELVSDYYSSVLEKSDILSLEIKRCKYAEVFKRIPADEAAEYHKTFEKAYIHGTTMIEGNTLTLREVTDLLEHGILPRKELREINEIQNYKKVRDYLKNYNGKVTVRFIQTLHSLIMDHILETPGNFRQFGLVAISGCDLALTPPDLIEDELEERIQTYYENILNQKYPFEQMMLFHYRFEMIHPFPDGNGRVGREVLNYMMTREKYPKFLIGGENREDYLSALRFGNEQKDTEMVGMFSKMYQRQLEKVVSEFDRLR